MNRRLTPINADRSNDIVGWVERSETQHCRSVWFLLSKDINYDNYKRKPSYI
jgi:hypothetical protein